MVSKKKITKKKTKKKIVKKKVTKKKAAKKKAKKKSGKKKTKITAVNPVGRPPLYKTPEEMQRVIDLYFLACRVLRTDDEELLIGLEEDDLDIIKKIEDVVPAISGLAYTLGMSTEAFRNYEQKDEFLATVKRAKQRVEMSLEQRLAGNAVTGSIFSLKNNFGWKDKIENNISGGLGLLDLSDKTDEELKGIIGGTRTT